MALLDTSGVPCKDLLNKNGSTVVVRTISSATLAAVVPTVRNLDSLAPVTALPVRVGPGVVPGLAASPLSPRKCINKRGVSVGTARGGLTAPTRKHSTCLSGGTRNTHESSFVPSTVRVVTATASSSILKFLKETEEEPDWAV